MVAEPATLTLSAFSFTASLYWTLFKSLFETGPEGCFSVKSLFAQDLFHGLSPPCFRILFRPHPYARTLISGLGMSRADYNLPW
jgi:hypothetical protein